MAAKKKATKVKDDSNVITAADIKSVDADLHALGSFKLGDKTKFAELGNVPTTGGIQRMLMGSFWKLGVLAKKEGKKLDVRPYYMAYADAFYNPKMVGARKRPEDDVLADNVTSYQKFANLPIELPYDTLPIVQHIMAVKSQGLSNRAAKIGKFIEKHGETAPNAAEIVAIVNPPKKAGSDAYNLDAALAALCKSAEDKMKDDDFANALNLTINASKAAAFKDACEALMVLRELTAKSTKAKENATTAIDTLTEKLAAIGKVTRTRKNGARA
jgi:hypothetical protein